MIGSTAARRQAANELRVAFVGLADFRNAIFDSTSGTTSIERINLLSGGGGNSEVVFSHTQFSTTELSAVLQIEGNGDFFTDTLRIEMPFAGQFDGMGFSFLFWLAGQDRVVINGSTGDDTITGTSAQDSISGSDGIDSLSGGSKLTHSSGAVAQMCLTAARAKTGWKAAQATTSTSSTRRAT